MFFVSPIIIFCALCPDIFPATQLIIHLLGVIIVTFCCWTFFLDLPLRPRLEVSVLQNIQIANEKYNISLLSTTKGVVKAELGQEIVFTCNEKHNAEGNTSYSSNSDKTKITLKRNGERVSLHKHDSNYIIIRATADENGVRYQCEAENIVDKVLSNEICLDISCRFKNLGIYSLLVA